MRVQLSLRILKPCPSIRYDWRIFSTSPDQQATYTAKVRDSVHLQDMRKEPGAGYMKCVKANELAKTRSVPVMERMS